MRLSDWRRKTLVDLRGLQGLPKLERFYRWRTQKKHVVFCLRLDESQIFDPSDASPISLVLLEYAAIDRRFGRVAAIMDE